jgi:hypothetical protein
MLLSFVLVTIYFFHDLRDATLDKTNVKTIREAISPGFKSWTGHELAIVGAGLSPGLISVRDCIPSCIQVLVANDLAFVNE